MTCYCFTNLGAASIGTIPPGTPGVIVEQFNQSSAVSHALYVPATPNAQPTHALYFLNNGTYWVIHPDYVTLEAAGAPPAGPANDCAAAMQNVLNYLLAVGQAKLQLWERDYYLSYAATIKQTNPVTDPLLNFSIIGRGRAISRLLIPWASEPPPQGLGAFKITYSSNDSTFLARDFSIIATGATASNNGCGTAMLVNYPGVAGGMGPGSRRSAIVAHIEIANDHVETNNVSWSYFRVGIDLTGAGHLMVFDVTFNGVDGSASFVENQCVEDGPYHDYPDESPAFLPDCHLVIDDCYDPHLVSLKLYHAKTGISHVTTGLATGGQGPQGFYMSDVRFTGFKTCLVHSQTRIDGSTAQCPDGMIRDCFFQFRDAGLNLTSVQQWEVGGCEFYSLGDGYNVGGDCQQNVATDLVVTDADTVAITGCRFNRTNPTSAPNRVNIQINTLLTPSGITANRFLIAHNQFGDQVSGGGNFGISAVQILATASDIQIGHNDYIGSYSGPVIDDQSSAVVAPLGYPTGGTAAAAAVVPNSGSGTTPPTLGSANAGEAWPATFSVLHYVTDGGGPTIPPGWTGWVLYSSGGKLYASNGGTPKQLAP